MTIEEEAQRRLAERYLELDDQQQKSIRATRFFPYVALVIFALLIIAAIWSGRGE